MLKLDHYKTIIFDLGGVIINLKEHHTVTAFQQLSSLPSDEVIAMYKPTAYTFNALEEYEMGKISSAEFRQILKDTLQLNANDEAIDHAWNQILGDIPLIRIEILKKLAQTHQIILLSNTNEIHRDAFEPIFSKQSGLKNFADLFHHVYYSFEMKDRKPNLSIYKTVLNNHKLNPSQTLFIDDNHKNAVMARRAGIHTIHLTLPSTNMEQLFHV
jgi:glucose-1-phosphatase